MSLPSPLARRFPRVPAGAGRLLPVMAGIGVAVTGNGALTTAVALTLSRPDGDPGEVRLILTAFPLGFLVGCLAARFCIPRLGHRRVFPSVVALAAIAAGGLAATSSPVSWFCLRMLGGGAMASLFIVSESWLNLYAGEGDRGNRGGYFAIYMMTTSLAVVCGQVLIQAVGPRAPHLFLVPAATLAAGAVWAGATLRFWPALPQRHGTRIGAAPVPNRRYRLWRLAPVTLVGVFQAGMTNMNVAALTPIYGARLGIPATAAIGLVSAFSIGGLLAQTPAGWLSDRLDRRLMLLAQGVLAALLCLAIMAAGGGSVLLLTVLFLCYGATALTIYPVGIAFANAQIDDRHMVSAAGGLLLLYSLGNVLTPGLAASLMAHAAPGALFLLLGGGAALVAATAGVALLRRPESRSDRPAGRFLDKEANS